METNLASENLQTIRTIMERSAVYRRALAPVMLTVGTIGVIAAVAAGLLAAPPNAGSAATSTGGLSTFLRSDRGFAFYWMGVGIIALIASMLLVRRQAWREQEQFWSPPTRRISEALMPPFIAGFVVAVFLVIYDGHFESLAWAAASLWAILYGCALNAAGFFTPRGMALFGRVLMLLGCGLLLVAPAKPGDGPSLAHFTMGAIFGGLQISYGIYLYFTERKRAA